MGSLVPRVRWRRLTNPACRHANDFLHTTPNLLLGPRFCNRNRSATTRYRKRIDSPKHLAKQPPVQMFLGSQKDAQKRAVGTSDPIVACSGGILVVSRAGQAYDSQAGWLNRKFRFI